MIHILALRQGRPRKSVLRHCHCLDVRSSVARKQNKRCVFQCIEPSQLNFIYNFVSSESIIRLVVSEQNSSNMMLAIHLHFNL